MYERQIFLDDLPKWETGAYRGEINWKESIGYKVKFTYENIEGQVEIVDYKYPNLYIKYLNKGILKMSTGAFQKCSLGTLIGRITKEFKVEIGTIFKDDKRNLVILDREYRKYKSKSKDRSWNEKWYKYHCNVCGWDEGWIEEADLLKGQGCSCCCINSRTLVQGINDIPTTAPWMVKYFQGGYDEAKLYTNQSSQTIKPICPICGRIKDKPMKISSIYNKKSIGCSCSDGQSYSFKTMFNVLKQLNIEFIPEYTPNWCKYDFKNKLRQGRYDFYFKINKENIIYKYIVEIDGGWHSEDNNMSGQTKEESKNIDDEKDRLAKEHGIKVIRIDAKKSELEYIKNNILNSDLNNLFDLSNIDWLKTEEFALSSLVKLACELKRDNPNMTTTEIGKLMKLTQVTIINYLKKGSKVWDWINYDPIEEKSKVSGKSGKMSRKPVEIFKNGISQGKFESCVDLDKQSEERFGLKLLKNCISLVCLGRWKQYKGYTFKYINKNNL